jgi:hypothetical protein
MLLADLKKRYYLAAMWKLAQLAVFIGLTVFIFENRPDSMRDYSHAIPAAAILALGLTVLVFAPLMHLKMRMQNRRERLGSGSQAGNSTDLKSPKHFLEL